LVGKGCEGKTEWRERNRRRKEETEGKGMEEKK